MPGLPTGTVTFLFTDIEGSTTLLQRLGDRRYAEVLEEHRRLLRAAFAEGNGQEIDRQGDSFLVAFSRARDVLGVAVAAQQVLTKHTWPDGASLRVRMGLHTGEPVSETEGYIGLDVHRAARICAAGHGGQILLSQAVGVLAAPDLPPGVSLRDLGTYRLKDLREPEHLFQVVHPDLPTDFPPLKSLDVLPNNLPRQLTSFVGREKEMAEVKRLLSIASLVTLTGTGGAGKTRLALQVAADLLGQYLDGVWLVELGALADAGLAPQTLASTLSVREQPGRLIIETLVDYLRPKTLLLVLDNCEHLLSACGYIADSVLRGCPNVKVLVTSREGLGIAGETLYAVPSLSIPDPHQLPSVEQLTQYEAVQLFIERATAIMQTFKVTQRNGQAVAQVCHRLDGIPLAIELGAARVRVLPVDEIVSRLGDQFRLLTGGSRMALSRHQTLQAAMDWSYDLLLEKERAVLRRLSVFAGGWSLEAAEVVCAREGIETSEVLDLLTHLVDKSLVVAEEQDGKGRYRLLETIRQYSRNRLLESGEVDIARTRHRDVFLALVESAETHFGGSNQAMWLERLEAEHDNLRAALESSLESGSAEPVLRLAKGLEEFWTTRGYWSEGMRWLGLILSTTNKSPTPLRAWALNAAGSMARRLGEIGRAVTWLEESGEMYRALGDQKGLSVALEDLGVVAYRQGDFGRAAALFEESISLARESDNKRTMTFSIYALGIVARLRGDYEQAEARGREALALAEASGLKRWSGLATDSLGLTALCRGEYERAKSLCERALALHKQEGYRFGHVASLNSLGLVACVRGDHQLAKALCDESLALSTKLGDKGTIARSLNILGRIAYCRGDYGLAAVRRRESLAVFHELGEKLSIAQCLEGLGAAMVSEPERAARLFAAAERLREAIGGPMPPYDRAHYLPAVAAVRGALQEQTLAAIWAEGRAMTLEQAIEYALGEAI